MLRKALLIDLGRMSYEPAWKLQQAIWQQRVNNVRPDTLLLVEHPSVVTLGKSGRIENLRVPLEDLARRGVEFFRVERGGDITFHGPGQLVGYPIFKLEAALAGVRGFVNRLEQGLIAALAVWGIRANRHPQLGTALSVRSGKPGPSLHAQYTGVWVGNDKIAALGIAVRRSVVFHGFALNVNTDLSGFECINPCGIPDRGVTSMARLLDRELAMTAVKHQVARSLEQVFELEFELAKGPG
jgi:lipoyl(octanoyl) transferase